MGSQNLNILDLPNNAADAGFRTRRPSAMRCEGLPRSASGSANVVEPPSLENLGRMKHCASATQAQSERGHFAKDDPGAVSAKWKGGDHLRDADDSDGPAVAGGDGSGTLLFAERRELAGVAAQVSKVLNHGASSG